MLVESANTASIRSRDEIIGANIMREQIELLKNLRDTNWLQFQSWDSIKLATGNAEKLNPGNFYTIVNDFSAGKTIQIEKLNGFTTDSPKIIAEFQKTPASIRLCIDSLSRYTHDCTGTNKKTNYGSFLHIEPLVTKNSTTTTDIPVDRAYKATVYFVSFNKGYRLISMSTIITDWKNQ
jgi:hypothetical protein